MIYDKAITPSDRFPKAKYALAKTIPSRSISKPNQPCVFAEVSSQRLWQYPPTPTEREEHHDWTREPKPRLWHQIQHKTMESEARFNSTQEKKMYGPRKRNTLVDRFATTRHVNQIYHTYSGSVPSKFQWISSASVSSQFQLSLARTGFTNMNRLRHRGTPERKYENGGLIIFRNP